jgi:hypothetical protein
VLAAADCNAGNTKEEVKGQIVLDDADLALAENEAMLTSFVPIDRKPNQSLYSGSVKRDGSFVVAGPSDSSGVAAEKHEVSLQTLLTDRFGSRYTSDKSRIEIDIVPDMGSVTPTISSGK